MANITIDVDWIDAASPIWGRVTHRLRVLARARRINRLQRARLRLFRGEMRDARWFADIGVDIERHGRRDWIESMARAMGGR